VEYPDAACVQVDVGGREGQRFGQAQVLTYI
jgi:hypothetical protein